jgi:hypothetical protein
VAQVEGGQAQGGAPNEHSNIEVKPEANAIATPVEGGQTGKDGVADEQSNFADIKPEVNALAEAAADGGSQGGQDNVLENEPRVKVEQLEQVDQTEVSSERMRVSTENKFDDPTSVPNLEGQPVTKDAVDKPEQESTAIAPEVSSSHVQPMTTDKVLGHPNDESFVVAPEASVSQERVDVSEPSESASEVTDLGMEQSRNRGKVNIEPVVESNVPEQLGDNMGSKVVNMGSEEVNMASDEVNVVSEVAKMGSDEVKIGSEVVKMASDEVKMDSDEVNTESKDIRMGSNEVNMESDEINMGASEMSMGSETRFGQVNVGSVETTNVESSVVETPSQATPAEDNFSRNVLEEMSTPVESEAIEIEPIEPQVSEHIEGSSVDEGVFDKKNDSEKSQAEVKRETESQQEADTTSEANPGEIVSDPERGATVDK